MEQLFPSPKVVIVDDEPEDAMPMLEALSKINIPATWYKGTGRDNYPQTPLSGVRLVILDLVLQGQIFDAKQSVGALFNLIAPNAENGPFFLAIWTEHGEEDKRSFLQALEHYNNGREPNQRITPYGVLPLYKSKFKSAGSFNIAEIKQEVINAIENLSPLDLLLNWETSCGRAATVAVSKILSLLGADNSFTQTANKTKLIKLLDQLVKASAGDNIPSGDVRSEAYKRALYEPLSYIHEDSVKHLAPKKDFTSTNVDLCMDSSGDNLKATSALNSLLLFDLASLKEVLPGSIYKLNETPKSRVPIIESREDAGYVAYVKMIFKNKFASCQENIFSSCLPVILEVSPACDFNNNKRKLLRFVYGLIVPRNLRDKEYKKGGLRAKYFNVIGPFIYQNEVHYMIIDSLHLFSIPTKAKLPTPLFRLRSHVLVDVQAWLGRHISRPGHLSLH